jgi:hypothetical protein
MSPSYFNNSGYLVPQYQIALGEVVSGSLLGIIGQRKYIRFAFNQTHWDFLADSSADATEISDCNG